MTCASCANHIERSHRARRVTASVNYATEKAKVTYPAGFAAEDLVRTVERTGYGASLPRPARIESASRPDDPEPDPTKSLRERLVISAVLSVPVVAVGMVPALQFDNWQWLSLTLAAPVVVWGGWPFHKAAWVNARHGSATMDTLVSVGTLAAFVWSVYALFWGTAGASGMTDTLSLTGARADGADAIYLEAAAGVTTFILAGAGYEARSKRLAGAALRALLDLGAKEVAVLPGGPSDVAERLVGIDQLAVGDYQVRPATSGVIENGTSTADASMVTGESVPPPRCGCTTRAVVGALSTSGVGWWCARPGSEQTPSSPRWVAWSRMPRTARRRSSASPTVSPASSSLS